MILDDIVAQSVRRIEVAKQELPLRIVRQQALASLDYSSLSSKSSRSPHSSTSSRSADESPLSRSAAFESRLSQPGISFICEIKRASPSRGLIAQDFPYLQIAREYESAGADAISVLTEPDFFQGSNNYLLEVSQCVQLPTLRKDFIFDEYQLFEARVLGASAVLLICALLDKAQLAYMLALADELELAALVETHTIEEVEKALLCGARIIGVNNRDLTTFKVDLDTSARLRPHVPPQVLFVSESGINTAADIEKLATLNINAVLVGESLMRATDKRAALQALRAVTL